MYYKTPEDIADVIDRLKLLSNQYNLVELAFQGCNKSIINTDKLPWNKGNAQLRFRNIALFFENNLPYPYMSTEIEVYVEDKLVVHYNRITFLDGEAFDSYFVLI